MKQKRRGFTLVEILTVVAIIAILVGMLFLGARYVGASARSRKTLVMLKNLQSMLTEFESRGGKAGLLTRAYLNPPLAPASPNGQEVMPQGVFTGDNVYNSGKTDFNPAIKQQILRTQAVMVALASVPENKAILDKLTAQSDGYLLIPGKNQAFPGPILLDAWGSPILFAPGKVDKLSPTWGATGLKITGDSSSPNASVQPPDGKGMFISAGPDGDFSQGDDNLYTYEK